MRAATPERTVAEGIAVTSPPRARQVRDIVHRSGGRFMTVGDDAIIAAQRDLARHGFLVEPTAAVCWAARDLVDDDPATTVLPLTGSGLKVSG